MWGVYSLLWYTVLIYISDDLEITETFKKFISFLFLVNVLHYFSSMVIDPNKLKISSFNVKEQI